MPADLLGPTLEEVQMWLRSASGWVPAGFVLNVEPVNARLGRVLVVEDDPGIATQLVRGLTRAGYETGSVTTRQGRTRLAGPRRLPARSRPARHGRRGGLPASPPGLRRGLPRPDVLHPGHRGPGAHRRRDRPVAAGCSCLVPAEQLGRRGRGQGRPRPARPDRPDETDRRRPADSEGPRRTTTGWSTTACRPATGSGCRPGQRELRRLATTFNTVAGRLEALVPGYPGWWTACSRWRARRTSYRCPPRWTWPR